MKETVAITPYNEKWPDMFAKEAALVQKALGSNCVEVHHVGSTSIPGMSAKPIIDMIPAVRDIAAVDQANDAMKKLGYTCNGEAGMLFRRFFTKDGFNVHVYETTAGELDRLLKFRDWMRTHPEDAAAYAKLKTDLAQQYANDRFRYTLGKENFIVSIDKKTGYDRLRIVKTLTDREWEAYHRIRKEQIFDPLKINYKKEDIAVNDPSNVYLVLYKGPDIVGVAHVKFHLADEAALLELAIDTPFQYLGLGSKFRAAIEMWLTRQGRKLVKG